MTATEAPPDELVVHILWLNAGLSCDGDSVALTAATQPAIAELLDHMVRVLGRDHPKTLATWKPACGEDGPHGIKLDEKDGYLLVALARHPWPLTLGRQQCVQALEEERAVG